MDLNSDGWDDLLLVNGSLDAQRLEPTVALRNIQGREFREWFYVPDFDAPGNFIGATTGQFSESGRPTIFLENNPRLRSVEGSGKLFVNQLARRDRENAFLGN